MAGILFLKDNPVIQVLFIAIVTLISYNITLYLYFVPKIYLCIKNQGDDYDKIFNYNRQICRIHKSTECECFYNKDFITVNKQINDRLYNIYTKCYSVNCLFKKGKKEQNIFDMNFDKKN